MAAKEVDNVLDDVAEEDWLESDDETQEQAGTKSTSRSNDYALASKDTSRVRNRLYDDGYRTGITVGKEAMIQPGFDAGYNEKGSPVGKKYGFLLGTISAIEAYVDKGGISVASIDGFSDLQREVKALRLPDLVERDWEALEHEREHGADISPLKRETEEERTQREARLDILQSRADEIAKRLLGGPVV